MHISPLIQEAYEEVKQEGEENSAIYNNRVLDFFLHNTRGRVSDIKRHVGDKSKATDGKYREALKVFIAHGLITANRTLFTRNARINWAKDSDDLKEISKRMVQNNVKSVTQGVELCKDMGVNPKDSMFQHILKAHIADACKGMSNEQAKKHLCSIVDEVKPLKFKKK